ncbi:hybrid sensor histidine kinase/response regulator [Variovorax sp. HJSM1_2]|uniref:hybrid sensor histidine kinase/response regulator n=1 Tax=Variovorax sp. HJSM1_2 TaxID=3366263 RepID=UPI003BE81F63
MSLTETPADLDASTLLYVDDEPQACKWFARMFGNEFSILTASGVDEALQILQSRSADIAVLLTDYRMPQRHGLELLRLAQRDHRNVVRVLVTAYAEKNMAITAVNEGDVYRILEKPLDEALTRSTLRQALAQHRQRSFERAMHEHRALAMRETLGFLAHELNTPLATVRGYMDALRQRYIPPSLEDSSPGDSLAVFREGSPGEVLAALESAERRTQYCQSLVQTFLHSARDAYPDASAPLVTASSLVESLLDEYPFDLYERSIMSREVQQDFSLPGRRELVYLVLCTLTKNALYALRGVDQASLHISMGLQHDENPAATGGLKAGRSIPWIRFVDNGPGIPAEILQHLTHVPMTTKKHDGGSGMGLLFCRRVMQAVGGSIEIHSPPGQGTHVTLQFRPIHIANPN